MRMTPPPTLLNTSTSVSAMRPLTTPPHLTSSPWVQSPCIPSRPEFPLVEEEVQNRAHDQRGQKGAPQPQPYGPPPMEGQYVTGHRQHGRRQPEAVTEESLEQAAKEVNEEGLDVEITEGGKEGQQQTDHCPHLPADGLGLRRSRRPAAPAPLPGRGAACPLSGRGGSALPSCVLLLCRGHGIILSGAGGRGSAVAAL